jgi:hypothetical protein
VEVVVTDVLLGVNSVEADGTEPWLDNATGGLCSDLVVHRSSPSMPGCIASGDVAPSPGYLVAVDLGVFKLGFSGSPGSPSPVVNQGQVEDSAEQARSRVTATDKLL